MYVSVEYVELSVALPLNCIRLMRMRIPSLNSLLNVLLVSFFEWVYSKQIHLSVLFNIFHGCMLFMGCSPTYN